jgi:hypothetical protein
MNIELQAIHSGYDRKTCWVQARPGYIPGEHPVGIVTMQKLRLTGDDVFYELNDTRSDDGGQTWSEPVAHKRALGRRVLDGGIEEGICDFTPTYHAKTGVLLATGHTVRYKGDNLAPQPRARSTAYSIYNSADRSWAPWKKLEMPQPKFFNEGAGCTQRIDLPNGDILLPTYFGLMETAKDNVSIQYAATVLRCAFDGQILRFIEQGNDLTLPGARGFAEPSLAHAAGKYFLTLRNDDAGYIAASEDGLHFDEPRLWTFDDGSDLGNYNTQQHWIGHNDELYLIYNRRGANNDHIPRHRAPLFIAQVDPDRLCVIRETEQILVPQRGARLGNFGVARVSDDEFWVVVAEWMQTKGPNWSDSIACEKYGSDNSIFLAKVRFT